MRTKYGPLTHQYDHKAEVFTIEALGRAITFKVPGTAVAALNGRVHAMRGPITEWATFLNGDKLPEFLVAILKGMRGVTICGDWSCTYMDYFQNYVVVDLDEMMAIEVIKPYADTGSVTPRSVVDEATDLINSIKLLRMDIEDAKPTAH